MIPEAKETATTRFLMTIEKPIVGEYCKGRETLENGQSTIVKTSIVEDLKELITGKFAMKTSDGDIFLVDVVNLI